MHYEPTVSSITPSACVFSSTVELNQTWRDGSLVREPARSNLKRSPKMSFFRGYILSSDRKYSPSPSNNDVHRHKLSNWPFGCPVYFRLIPWQSWLVKKGSSFALKEFQKQPKQTCAFFGISPVVSTAWAVAFLFRVVFFVWITFFEDNDSAMEASVAVSEGGNVLEEEEEEEEEEADAWTRVIPFGSSSQSFMIK